MQTVKLVTENFLPVAEVETLPWQIWPEVMLWGNRVFIQVDTDDDSDTPVYREARGHVVIPVQAPAAEPLPGPGAVTDTPQ